MVKDIKRNRLVLPLQIARLIESYWDRSGERLKAYRDLSQHHGVVSSDGRIGFFPDGSPFVYLVLPNNPAEKQFAKLSYLDPRIDALPYIVNSYCELYSFAFKLADILLGHTTDTGVHTYVWNLKGPLRLGGEVDGHRIVRVQDILTSLESLVLNLKRPDGT
jgi:hypothetical protein